MSGWYWIHFQIVSRVFVVGIFLIGKRVRKWFLNDFFFALLFVGSSFVFLARYAYTFLKLIRCRHTSSHFVVGNSIWWHAKYIYIRIFDSLFPLEYVSLTCLAQTSLNNNNDKILFTTIRNLVHSGYNLPGVIFPRGFAPSIAKLTFALRPSIIGFGSLQARSALARLPIITKP